MKTIQKLKKLFTPPLKESTTEGLSLIGISTLMIVCFWMTSFPLLLSILFLVLNAATQIQIILSLLRVEELTEEYDGRY